MNFIRVFHKKIDSNPGMDRVSAYVGILSMVLGTISMIVFY